VKLLAIEKNNIHEISNYSNIFLQSIWDGIFIVSIISNTGSMSGAEMQYPYLRQNSRGIE
jgi:hypothetical protein